MSRRQAGGDIVQQNKKTKNEKLKEAQENIDSLFPNVVNFLMFMRK